MRGEHTRAAEETSWGLHAFMGLFFLSGAAGLVYQVLWVRQFTLVLGASSQAVTIVLTSFMFGLGLGSWLLGRLADRLDDRGLLRTYIGIELMVGLYALALPALIQGMEFAFVSFYRLTEPGFWLFNGSRLVLAFALLAIPTTLIGGTLPVLGRLVIHRRRGVAVKVSRLYGANTTGAIAGVVATGYVLLPSAGIAATTLTAVGLNVLVAAGFWFVGRTLPRAGHPAPPPTHDSRARRMTPMQYALALGFGLSGMAAMFYEVAWTRTLEMVLGTTTYAFTTMLSVILLGIALGSLLYPLVPQRISRTALFVGLQLTVAFSVLLAIPVFSRLPFVYLSLSEILGGSWADLQFLRFLMAGLVMLVPTTALGAMLPTVSAIFVDRADNVGSRLGKACAANTLGATMGAALGGLVLVPALGMQKTIVAGAGLNLAAALAVMALGAAPASRRLAVSCFSVALAALVVAAISPWSPKVMSSGTYVYADRYLGMADRYADAARKSDLVPGMSRWQVWKMAMEQYDLLYYRTGPSATVSVMQRADGVRFMAINGKTDASNGYKSDMRTQVMIGQLPMLFHPDPDRVLVVGLGSGVTAGSVLTHPARVVDCVEISPAVTEAARYFDDDNHHALDDPRLRLMRRDARNYLLTTQRRYDVIISQPSNPWVSGEASLFSLEWYESVRDRLEDGGLLVQWLPTYFMAERDLKVILHTLRTVFPNVSLWTSGAVGDVVILARKAKPLRIDYEHFLQRVRRPAVMVDISRLGMTPELLPLELFVMNRDELAAYLQYGQPRGLPMNTDDLLHTEFATPKRMVSGRKVARFMVPKNLHGHLEDMDDMLFNLDRNLLIRLMEKGNAGIGAGEDGANAARRSVRG